MKKPLLCLLASGALLAACPLLPAAAQKAPPGAKPAAHAKTTKAAPAASVPLAALLEAYSEETARLFPLAATTQGDNRYNDQLPNDRTQARRELVRDFYQRYLARLQKMDRARLSLGS